MPLIAAGCGKDSTGSANPDLNDTEDDHKVHIRGLVTQVNPTDSTKANLTGSILVEGVIEKDTFYDKAWVTVPTETEIWLSLGDNLRKATFSDLQPGALVEVTFTGLVNESYPVQATAKSIIIYQTEEITFSRINLANLPPYFQFYGTLDEDKLIGLTKGSPFIYSRKENTGQILSEIDYWNLKLSPDKTIVALNNEHGVSILNLVSGKEEVVFSKGEYFLNDFFVHDFMWSSDACSLLLTQEQEWGWLYKIFDLRKRELVSTELQGTLKPIWLDENKVVAINYSLFPKENSGETTYSSNFLRSDLVLYQLATEESTTLTDAADGEYFHYLTTLPGIIYFEQETENGRQLVELNLATNSLASTKLNKHQSMDSQILAILDENNFVLGKNIAGSEVNGRLNNMMELTYYYQSNPYSLGEWEYADSSPKVFLLGKSSLVISSDYRRQIGNQSFTTLYQAALFTLRDSNTGR
jgi:hypothetical protein